MSVLVLPAHAFVIINTGTQAGNPPSDLYTVGIEASDVGQSFTENYSVTLAGGQILSGNIVFTVNAVSSTMLNLTTTVSNTTSTLFQENIMSFGFSIDPNASSLTVITPGAVFDSVQLTSSNPANFPGGFKLIDFCAYAANNCSGGNVNQGLTPGSTDTLTLAFSGTFNTSGPIVTLDSFPIKFQGEFGSFEPAGGPPVITPPPNQVPEPFTLGLLGIGLLALGATRRRRL